MTNLKFNLVLFTLGISYSITSCSVFDSKNLAHDYTIYRWENKIVTKKKYDKLLNQHINEFVKNSKPEDLELFYNMTVVYDTIPKHQNKN